MIIIPLRLLVVSGIPSTLRSEVPKDIVDITDSKVRFGDGYFLPLRRDEELYFPRYK